MLQQNRILLTKKANTDDWGHDYPIIFYLFCNKLYLLKMQTVQLKVKKLNKLFNHNQHDNIFIISKILCNKILNSYEYISEKIIIKQ